MQDARVVRRLIAAHPDLSSAWKRALGVGLHLDTTISEMEKRLADLRARRDKIVAPLNAAREQMTRAINGERPADKKALVALVQQARHVVDGVLDFDERNHMQQDLDELEGRLGRLP